MQINVILNNTIDVSLIHLFFLCYEYVLIFMWSKRNNFICLLLLPHRAARKKTFHSRSLIWLNWSETLEISLCIPPKPKHSRIVSHAYTRRQFDFFVWNIGQPNHFIIRLCFTECIAPKQKPKQKRKHIHALTGLA